MNANRTKFLEVSALRHGMIFLIAFAVAVLAPHNVYATSCSTTTHSLERRLLESSFVFTGIPDSRAPRHLGQFRYDRLYTVTHVYKEPSGGMPKNAQVYVEQDFAGKAGPDKEYLVFGYQTKVDGDVVTTKTSYSCGGSTLTADAQITELQEKKKKPNLFSDGEWPVIFTGHVKKVLQWNDTRYDPPVKYSSPVIMHAIVEFEILELFRNTPKRHHENSVDLQEKQSIRVFMHSCGDSYKTGHNYLVKAEDAAPRKLEDAPDLGDVHYSSQCGESVDLDEKEILDKLGQQQ